MNGVWRWRWNREPARTPATCSWIMLYARCVAQQHGDHGCGRGEAIRREYSAHGHFDHFGRSRRLPAKEPSTTCPPLDVYVRTAKTNFCNRKTASGAPGHFADWGVLDRRELDASRSRCLIANNPGCKAMPSPPALSSGAASNAYCNTLVRISKKNGIGCDMPEANAKGRREVRRRRTSGRTWHRLQSQGSRPRGDFLLRPCRHRQYRPASH